MSIDGQLYLPDESNDGWVTSTEVEDNVGLVAQTYACEDGLPDSSDDGIWGTTELEGDEIYRLPGRPQEQLVGIMTDGSVQVYRSAAGPPIEMALEEQVVSVRINSAIDGETTLAQIGDPVVISELTSSALAAGSGGEPVGDIDYFIEFQNDDGLRTVVPYRSESGLLDDRPVGDEWENAIQRALLEAPDVSPVDELTVASASGTVDVLPLGSCRQDRVGIQVRPGDTLTAQFDESLDLRWFFNPPEPSGDPVTSPSQVGATAIVPNFEGVLVAEMLLFTTDGEAVVDGCITIRSDNEVAIPDPELEPSGIVECGDRDVVSKEFGPDEAEVASSIVAAFERWQTDSVRVDEYGPTRMTSRVSDYSTTVDLVDGDGSVRAVLLFANNGDGWFVQTELLCAGS